MNSDHHGIFGMDNTGNIWQPPTSFSDMFFQTSSNLKDLKIGIQKFFIRFHKPFPAFKHIKTPIDIHHGFPCCSASKIRRLSAAGTWHLEIANESPENDESIIIIYNTPKKIKKD